MVSGKANGAREKSFLFFFSFLEGGREEEKII